MLTVVRITRHPADDDRIDFLKEIYGADVNIVTDDIPYGDDPVASVKALIERYQTGGTKVVAVEAQAPFPVLMKLIENRNKLNVTIIRAQFKRNDDGRALVTGKDKEGRDILKFSHYEELLRIEFETRPLKK